jgi:hypothetical protein
LKFEALWKLKELSLCRLLKAPDDKKVDLVLDCVNNKSIYFQTNLDLGTDSLSYPTTSPTYGACQALEAEFSMSGWSGSGSWSAKLPKNRSILLLFGGTGQGASFHMDRTQALNFAWSVDPEKVHTYC